MSWRAAPAARLGVTLPWQPPQTFPFLLPPDRYASGKTFRGRAEARLCQSHRYTFLKHSTRICAEFKGQVRATGDGEEARVVVLEMLPQLGVLGLMMAGCIIWASPGDPPLM